MWIRLPPDDGAFEEQLGLLADRALSMDRTVHLDKFNRLFVGSRWIALSEIQARLASVLVADFGEVISELRLLDARWPDQPRSAGNLRVQGYRPRARPLQGGLELETLTAAGVVVHPDPGGPHGFRFGLEHSERGYRAIDGNFQSHRHDHAQDGH